MKYEVISIEKKTATLKDGSPIFKMVLTDDQGEEFKGDCFEKSFESIKAGDTVDVILKPNPKFEGTYYINPVKAQGAPSGGSKFPPKDWNFEKRKVALDTAMKLATPMSTSKDVLKEADEYLKWLNS